MVTMVCRFLAAMFSNHMVEALSPLSLRVDYAL